MRKWKAGQQCTTVEALKFLPGNSNISVIFSFVFLDSIFPYELRFLWFFLCQVIFVVVFVLYYLWNLGSYLYSMRMIIFFWPSMGCISNVCSIFKASAVVPFLSCICMAQGTAWDLTRNLLLAQFSKYRVYSLGSNSCLHGSGTLPRINKQICCFP